MAADGSGRALSAYRETGMFRRTVAAIPQYKRLVRVSGLKDWPRQPGQGLGHLCPDVVFRTLQDDYGRCFWAKQWLNDRVALEDVTAQIERALAPLGRPELVLAEDRTDEHGLVYPYRRALFDARAVVHQWDLHWYFTQPQVAAIQEVAALVVDGPWLPAVPLGQLTDFQAVREGDGWMCLDFEPSARYARALAGVVIP